MARHPIRSAVWFVVTAAGVYGTAVLVAAGLAMANGEALSCRDAECGAISNWLNDAYPVPMIAAITVAVIAGVMTARRHTAESRRPAASPYAVLQDVERVLTDAPARPTAETLGGNRAGRARRSRPTSRVPHLPRCDSDRGAAG